MGSSPPRMGGGFDPTLTTGQVAAVVDSRLCDVSARPLLSARQQ